MDFRNDDSTTEWWRPQAALQRTPAAWRREVKGLQEGHKEDEIDRMPDAFGIHAQGRESFHAWFCARMCYRLSICSTCNENCFDLKELCINASNAYFL